MGVENEVGKEEVNVVDNEAEKKVEKERKS